MGGFSEARLGRRLSERLTDQEFGALSGWCENMECSIDLVDWLSGGNTEAKLALVRIQDRRYGQRKGVLKYCPAGSKPEIPRDFQAFLKAAESGPVGFARKHLVSFDPAANAPIMNGRQGLFILMEWRGSGRKEYNTMTTLLEREILGAACKSLVTSILGEWNSGGGNSGQRDRSLTARDFLHEIVGERCQPDGSIYAMVQRLAGSAGTRPPLTDLERELPDKITAAASDTRLEKHVFGVRGNAHGDLHLDNILMPLPPHTKLSAAHFKQYILIDLSNFDDSRLLAADPAHLTLSVIARRLPDLSFRDRALIPGFLIDPEQREAGGIPVGIVSAARAIQKAGSLFADRKNLYDEWRAENLLAMTGSALLFVGRPLPSDDRRWFLRFAALALNAFFETQPGGGGGPAEGDGLSGGVRASLQGELAPVDPPALTGEPEGTPDRSNVVPIRDEIVLPASTSPPSESPAVAGAEKDSYLGAKLVDELVAEISGLNEGLAPDEASSATTSARDVVEELEGMMTGIGTEGYSGPVLGDYDAATAETALIRLHEVKRLLSEAGDQGTGDESVEELKWVVDSLREFMRGIPLADKDDRHPGS